MRILQSATAAFPTIILIKILEEQSAEFVIFRRIFFTETYQLFLLAKILFSDWNSDQNS
jgi:hypothetical protein